MTEKEKLYKTIRWILIIAFAMFALPLLYVFVDLFILH